MAQATVERELWGECERVDVFLVPKVNAEAAIRAARSVRVVAVDSSDEALAALRVLTGGMGVGS